MLTWCDADSATGNLTGSPVHYAIDLQPFSRPCNHQGKALSRCIIKSLCQRLAGKTKNRLR
jgi:hypothetical protein